MLGVCVHRGISRVYQIYSTKHVREMGVSGSTWVSSNFSSSFVAQRTRRTRQVTGRSSREDRAELTMMSDTRDELM